MRALFIIWYLALVQGTAISRAGADTGADPDQGGAMEEGWIWKRILSQPIVANGNVWPEPDGEKKGDCVVLVNHNQIMQYCHGNETSYDRTTIHRSEGWGKYRGVFMALGSSSKEGKGRRMWVLESYLKKSLTRDDLVEIDTVTGKILQRLVIPDSFDGHDAVRVGNRAFIVDTRHGNIIEISIPPSSEPFYESSIEAGAEKLKIEGHVNVVKRHTGHTRADHINNVAIHPDLLLTSLHGKDGMKPSVKEGSNSATRLSALDRQLPEGEGRELTLEQDGFHAIDNVGTWCHGIAFWKDPDTDEIKLIGLDSKSGSLVSVALVGSNYGKREVLWSPDLTHPVLNPPDGVARAYNNGAKIFSKGLAVQAGVAYFGVSYARAPPLRQVVPESLLVAVDLHTKEEIFARTILSNGLINQILTKSYLGDVQLPEDISSMELTQHDGGGTLVNYCEDLHESCKAAYDDPKVCKMEHANHYCCACKGGKRTRRPILHGVLGDEISKIDETPNATVTFVPHHNCRGKSIAGKYIHLDMKRNENLSLITSIQNDLDKMVKHICNVDVELINFHLEKLGDEGFEREFQHTNDNAIIEQKGSQELFKPGVKDINLIFSSKSAHTVYHFPWLKRWYPMIQESILEPLGIPLNQIIRMQFASMPVGSHIHFHRDLNEWVTLSHRIHIPIVTHPDIFFLMETSDKNSMLRIKSNTGEVFEINNRLMHSVKNLGSFRVHLIIDWVEESSDRMSSLQTISLLPKEVCRHDTGKNELTCGNFEINDSIDQQRKNPVKNEL